MFVAVLVIVMYAVVVYVEFPSVFSSFTTYLQPSLARQFGIIDSSTHHSSCQHLARLP